MLRVTLAAIVALCNADVIIEAYVAYKTDPAVVLVVMVVWGLTRLSIKVASSTSVHELRETIAKRVQATAPIRMWFVEKRWPDRRYGPRELRPRDEPEEDDGVEMDDGQKLRAYIHSVRMETFSMLSAEGLILAAAGEDAKPVSLHDAEEEAAARLKHRANPALGEHEAAWRAVREVRERKLALWQQAQPKSTAPTRRKQQQCALQ